MQRLNTLIILLTALILTACSTPYQDRDNIFSMTGGYSNEKAPGNLDKIYFYGNGYTSKEQTEQYALRRAAEIGKQRNKPYFAAYGSLSDAALDRKITTPPVSMEFNMPTTFFYATYHKKKEPGDFSVNQILQSKS